MRTSGVGVVHGVVGQDLISAVLSTAAVRSMPTRKGHRQTKEWRLSASGRFHIREEDLDESDVKILERVEAAIWPLVEAFFTDDGENGMHGIYRSEMQVCDSSCTGHVPHRSHPC